MKVCKISNKGQVVIPKEIRDKMGFRSGDVVIFKIKENYVVLEKVEESMAEILKKSQSLTDDGLTFQKKLRDEWNY